MSFVFSRVILNIFFAETQEKLEEFILKKNLKKSLFAGLAALSFVAVAGTATQASAKSYAKATSNTALTSDATKRNVTFTGTSALYTKAGTLKGARVVAGKSTLSNLAASKDSKDNFRAYRVATTNRGSVYYKVASFDGNYRGWIYGGKDKTTIAGGIKSYDTFTAGTLTDDQKNSTYKIGQTGTANDFKTVTYTYPAWTQYKQGRVITDSTPYKEATFKIDQTGTRTREGDQWVHITATDTKNSAANGWILASGLQKAGATTPDDNFDANKSVKVQYRDTTTGKTLDKTNTWTTAGSDSKQGAAVNANYVDNSGRTLGAFITNTKAPSGYAFKTSDGKDVAADGSNLTSAPALSNATFGATLTLDVTPVAGSTKVSFYQDGTNGSSITALKASDFALGFPGLTDSAQSTALPAGGDKTGTFSFAKYFAADGPFAKALAGANTAYTAKAGSLTDPDNGNKATGVDKVGFFGQNVPGSNGASRYFYVYDATASDANNAATLSNGSTVKVAFQRFVTKDAVNTKDANQNANTNYIAQ